MILVEIKALTVILDFVCPMKSHADGKMMAHSETDEKHSAVLMLPDLVSSLAINDHNLVETFEVINHVNFLS